MPSCQAEHAASGVSKAGDPAQEVPQALCFASSGRFLRWVPDALGQKVPSYVWHDEGVVFTRLPYASRMHTLTCPNLQKMADLTLHRTIYSMAGSRTFP